MTLRTIRGGLWLAAAALTLMCLPATRAADADKQVWVFMKVVDRLVEGQKIEIQIPLEMLRDWGTLRIWDSKHEKVVGELNGASLYNAHKDLAVRKEVKVATYKPDDADIVVIISSREPARGNQANRLHIQDVNRADNHQNREVSYSLAELPDALRAHLDKMDDKHRIRNRIDGLERLQYSFDRLAELPGFVLLKMDGGDHRLTLKTE